MKYYLLVLVVAILGISACKKEKYIDYEALALEQYGKDTLIINKFIADNNIPAVKDSTIDIYYQIIEPGTGTAPTDNSPVKVEYKGRLLNGVVFDSTKTATPVTFPALGELITGWRIGLRKIKPGGKIRLIIPSGFGYGDRASGKIPANSILDFDIELKDIK